MLFSLLIAPAAAEAALPPSNPGTPPMSDSPWSLLPAASANAEALDTLYIFFWILCGIAFVGMIGVQAYFMWKYRKPAHGHAKTSPLTHNGKLEFIWSAIPTFFFVILFAWGEIEYMKQVTPPPDALDVRVTGQKWSWTIEYPEVKGCSLTNDLYVPVGQPMRLTMTSMDVIHSFYLPAFRLKKDVVPGRYTVLWFEATKPGLYPLMCTEYCGDEHSSMVGRVHVVPQEEYGAVLAKACELKQGDTESTEDFGARVLTRGGCASCHTTDGTVKTGPSFKGLFGKTETLADGSTVTVDENYIRESILEPNAKIVSGFSPQMPSFAGRFDDKQIAALIAYIKAQK
ncbi:cytochrome c oxidase subunit 2 [Nannocystis exedens]|uniref:Cytochrome c oxidase subunit 2 n=1 Tax=Nannocystis exedens TaxID=54 RepID=A0A1I1VL54_9BACT|nr:cytochrome c oxidase subunit II [Nannocystis exedens]PCC72630.1 cytochrome c oxidase polypeptide II [Nannocystis exedens]SFD83661.1 cytochrome c oxidase subunit 2 [Nannocystis exedens]